MSQNVINQKKIKNNVNKAINVATSIVYKINLYATKNNKFFGNFGLTPEDMILDCSLRVGCYMMVQGFHGCKAKKDAITSDKKLSLASVFIGMVLINISLLATALKIVG